MNEDDDDDDDTEAIEGDLDIELSDDDEIE